LSTPLRKPLAFAAVLAAGSFAALGGIGTANASQPNNPASGAGPLTSSNGSQIMVTGGSSITPQLCGDVCFSLGVREAQWAPDGSKAVFVDPDDQTITTVRFNNAQDVWFIADPTQGLDERHSPTFRGSGSTLVWSEKSNGGHFRIVGSTSGLDTGITPVTPLDANEYTDPDGGPDGRVVFERNGTEVVLWDGSGTASGDFTDVVAGADPSMSPAGNRVAYVSGGQIWTADLNGANPTQVTNEASAAFSNPTWSPDGLTIAFNSGTAVKTVLVSSGVVSNSALNGIPAYRSQQINHTSRLAGSSRFSTAAAVSGAYWKTKGDGGDTRHVAQSVVLSRSDTFADALGGAALAAAKEGPLLLTPSASLEPAAADEINRVLNPGDTVYLLGSPGALSTTVENQITALGYVAHRVAGTDRFSTSVAIANEINPNPDLILVATGMNFPDALGAGAAAGSYDVPGSDLSAVVVLTADSTLPAATQTYLDSQGGLILGIGKQGVNATVGRYGEDRVIQVFGDDRYETAYWVSSVFFGGQQQTGVATGTNWPDALSGGALMGTLNGPLVLTPGTASSTSFWTAAAMSDNSASVSLVLAFGSPAVVSNAQLNQFGTLIGGPLGSTAISATFPVGLSGPALRSTNPAASGGHKTVAELKAAVKALQENR